MTGWPTLDGPDAERAIGAACLRMGEPTTTAWSADLIAALNDADVVLCDHTALAALRQRAIDAEALIDDVRRLASDLTGSVDWAVRVVANGLLRRHNLTDDLKDGTR